MNLLNLLHHSRQSISEFWRMRNARERAMLSVASTAAALGLFYTLLIDPALTDRNQLQKTLPELRQQVAQLQALSKEAAALSGKSAPPVTMMSEESIKTALARKGLNQQSVMLTGNLAKVQLASVSFAGTLEWLDNMQKTAGISVVEANIVALPQPDRVNATLTLRQH